MKADTRGKEEKKPNGLPLDLRTGEAKPMPDTPGKEKKKPDDEPLDLQTGEVKPKPGTPGKEEKKPDDEPLDLKTGEAEPKPKTNTPKGDKKPSTPTLEDESPKPGQNPSPGQEAGKTSNTAKEDEEVKTGVEKATEEVKKLDWQTTSFDKFDKASVGTISGKYHHFSKMSSTRGAPTFLIKKHGIWTIINVSITSITISSLFFIQNITKPSFGIWEHIYPFYLLRYGNCSHCSVHFGLF